ncbi:YdcF family protein [Hydrogenovibrio crunogenus]|uniref:YdcF family protein n=1 Tax=Hydrogenovibrio crunogenus TaxID=39765 RepID=UPI00294FF744|nr:YdcF family protein [Hydrogenovibrio crunogenus]
MLFNRTETAKTLLLPASLAGFIVLAFPIGDLLIQPLEQRFKSPETLPKDIDGIIVLGGGEDLKRSLSWGRPELGIGGDRYIGAKELANHYPKAPVIFTGGSGSMQLQNTKGEGSLARQLLTTLGIANKRLIIESLSRNTYENFKYTKKLLPARQGTYMLVTSAFHMPRAVGIANKQAIHVIPYPVDYRGNSDKLRKIDFDFFDHLKSLEPAWKEWIGLTVYYWTGKTSDWLPETTLQTSQ